MRPTLKLEIDPEEFLNYYWLKDELNAFCSNNNLPTSGNKNEISQRIYQYLKTGVVIKPTKKIKSTKIEDNFKPSLEAIIPQGYKNDTKHRVFFKSIIGDHFKYNVQFMSWIKNNQGKTYKDAVNAWNVINNEKKQGIKPQIAPQFQYNQYTSDFFKENPNAKRADAIKCWKYKKGKPGHNRYEKEDLSTLCK